MATVAYRAIRKRRAIINAPNVRRVLDAAMDNVAKPALIAEHEKRVANWEHAPDFKARKYTTQNATKISVFPAGPNKQIYKWVSEGTSAHPIRPKKPGGVLVFPWGGPGSYKAKTGTGNRYGGPGIVVGGTLRYFKAVNHPGFEGRHFDKFIKAEFKPEYSRIMENAWRRAIRSMNSG